MPSRKEKTSTAPAGKLQPHIGALLSKCMLEKRMSNAEMGRRMGVSASGVTRYQQQPSLQAGIIWKAGLALEHNLFAEIGRAFPVPFYDEVQQQADEALHAATERIAALEKELAIYKSIVMAGK